MPDAGRGRSLAEGGAPRGACGTRDGAAVQQHRELYDLRRDPFQLDGRVASADPALLAALSQRLAELRNCTASQCRELKDRPVELTPPAAVTAR